MIYYIAFYNPIQELGNRVANYAGEDKIDYICDAINDLGESVTILSNAKSIVNRFLKKSIYTKSENRQVVMFASLPSRGRLLHAIDVMYGYFQLAVYLLNHVKKDDVVLVYHSLGYRDIIRKIRNIKKFRYILEVEELYQYIERANSSFKEKENIVFKTPDAFIFSNSFLNDKINTNKKPAVVVNGIYKTEQRLEDKIIHHPIKIVYAGTLEPQKGVDFLIRTAEFLDKDYEVRIIGFGGEKDMERVTNLIEEINSKSTCKVYFDGAFKGKQYFRYIQSCDIGVCIQDPNDSFNLYEFPSKIFSYLSNGLNVVANRIAQIEHSKVYNYLTIAESTEPEKIAAAIRMVNLNNSNSELMLQKLDSEFKQDLKKIIKGE